MPRHSRDKKSEKSKAAEEYGKHSGGNGKTMKDAGSWNGRKGKSADKTDTERIGKQKG